MDDATGVEKKHGQVRNDKEISEAVAAIITEVDKLSERVVAIKKDVDGAKQVSRQEFTDLTELLMRQLLKLDGIEAVGEAKRKAEVARAKFCGYIGFSVGKKCQY